MLESLRDQSRFTGVVTTQKQRMIEIFYENPQGTRPSQILLLLHPHPLHGGNWHNKLITMMARTAHQLGYATLRPHFSSIGRTPGPFMNMPAEVVLIEDLIASIKATIPEIAITGGGFSFGGGVLLGLKDPSLPRFVIAPSWHEIEAWPLTGLEHLTLVHAYDDPIIPVQSSFKLAEKLQPQKNHRYHYFGTGGHFFQGLESDISEIFKLFLQVH